MGTGQAPGTAFNRRYLLKDGTTKMNPGKLNPAIVRAAGPVDEELPVVLFHDAKTGKPFGSFCSFAMHVAVYGGDTFSADYPGHLQRELRKVYGTDFISVFAEGCAGDVNHVDVRTRDKDPTPEQLGQKLAAAITAVKWAESGEPKLRFSTTTVAAKLRADRAQDVAISKNRLIGELAKKAGFLEQVEAYRVLLVNQMHVETGPTRPLPVQAFALDNDTAIVTLPHEVFVEHGLEIRKRSPYKHTVIVTIANEVDCYVPTRMAFTEGSYEVTNSPYEPGVAEQLVGAALKLLTELQQPITPN